MIYRHHLPRSHPGEVVGLLGGSFDPPHPGHLQISRAALARFRLDRLWWLVSPGNPLKAHGPAGIERRIAAARALIEDPRILVTGVEARLGTRYTAETLGHLFRLYPATRFVWLMGTDNLAQFHLWERWDWIMESLPIGVIARPGSRLAARLSPAARRFGAARLRESDAGLLAGSQPPAWCLINVPMSGDSSSTIRARGDWPA